MDKGLLELDPTYAKLEYCIVIPKSIQDKLVEGVRRLSGVYDAFLESPRPGNYPEQNQGKNVVLIGSNELGTKTEKFTYPAWICQFSLTELPGCCGILVSHSMFIYPAIRRKGVATFLQEIKEDIARWNGYTTMIATVVQDNTIEIGILERAGWIQVPFLCVNRRTGNTILQYQKEVNYG